MKLTELQELVPRAVYTTDQVWYTREIFQECKNLRSAEGSPTVREVQVDGISCRMRVAAEWLVVPEVKTVFS